MRPPVFVTTFKGNRRNLNNNDSREIVKCSRFNIKCDENAWMYSCIYVRTYVLTCMNASMYVFIYVWLCVYHVCGRLTISIEYALNHQPYFSKKLRNDVFI